MKKNIDKEKGMTPKKKGQENVGDRQISIEEYAESLKQQPESEDRYVEGECHCKCAGCDQGYHCHKKSRGCGL